MLNRKNIGESGAKIKARFSSKDKRVGIYVHTPFCASKCAYRNFYSVAGSDGLMPSYQSAVLKHIEEYSPQLEGYRIDTVYFGGGTPNYYGVDRLVNILNALKKHGRVISGAEVTAEINPGSIVKDDLKVLRRAGFNRLSIGVQCADDKILKRLGRAHTFADAEETVKNARQAGFDNISVDIIYGLPSQKNESWVETVERTAAFGVEHISCYGLKLEEGTPLYSSRDSLFIPDDDVQADMYISAVEMLARFGYILYEVSNFARQGFESKHNMKYWIRDEYIGIGPGAHSYIGGCRYSFIEDVREYIDRVMQGQEVVDYKEVMSDFENAGEYLMLRLRTANGISEEEYYRLHRQKMDLVLELLQKYELNGWVLHKNDRWAFTPTGFMLSNTLIGEVLDAQRKQHWAERENSYSFFRRNRDEK